MTAKPKPDPQPASKPDPRPPPQSPPKPDPPKPEPLLTDSSPVKPQSKLEPELEPFKGRPGQQERKCDRPECLRVYDTYSEDSYTPLQERKNYCSQRCQRMDEVLLRARGLHKIPSLQLLGLSCMDCCRFQSSTSYEAKPGQPFGVERQCNDCREVLVLQRKYRLSRTEAKVARRPSACLVCGVEVSLFDRGHQLGRVKGLLCTEHRGVVVTPETISDPGRRGPERLGARSSKRPISRL